MARAKSLFHNANHAINYCARSIAKNAVKEQLRAQGVRVTLVKPAEIAERARVYLDQHPETFTLALERAVRLGWIDNRHKPDKALETPMWWGKRPVITPKLPLITQDNFHNQKAI